MTQPINTGKDASNAPASTPTTNATAGDVEVSNQKTLGLFAVILLVVGAFALFKEVDTVWQLVKHSVMLVVWYWIACSGLFGAVTLWGARVRGLRVKDYVAIALAPFAVFLYAYKGAKTIGSAKERLTQRRRSTTGVSA